MKYIRISLAVLAALAVLGIAGRYFVEWSLNGAFQPAMKEAAAFDSLPMGWKRPWVVLWLVETPDCSQGRHQAKGRWLITRRIRKRSSVTRNTSRLGTLLWLSRMLAARVSINWADGKAVQQHRGSLHRREPMPGAMRSVFNLISKKPSLSVPVRRPSAPSTATV